MRYICTKVYPSCIGPNFDDFYQAGCLGLVVAADRYDPDKGFQFSTYAYRYIIGAVSRTMKYDFQPNNGTISLDSPAPDAEDLSLMDMVADETDCFDGIEIEELRFLETLDDTQRHVWNRRKDGATFRQISEELGITHQAVQLKLKKIRGLYDKFSKEKG